ncbi:MAG: hypothetical protein Ct9H300mP31_04210 [Acidimicrobiaceae bacterium]|nr:MAG: hypothetical protein Ct9H300mP31_04210 [Acidimicrobiaceae bacterium]
MKDLSVDGLGMVYELPKGGSVEALHNVSFDLKAGRLLRSRALGVREDHAAQHHPRFLARPPAGPPGRGPHHRSGQERGMVFQQGPCSSGRRFPEVAFGPRMNRKKRSETEPLVRDLLSTVGLQGFGTRRFMSSGGCSSASP